jgi:hypothetical protein
MEKKIISTSGVQQTIVNFTGIKQTTINDWMSRPLHPYYDLCQDLKEDLIKAQEKVLAKWSKNTRLNNAIERTIARRHKK